MTANFLNVAVHKIKSKAKRSMKKNRKRNKRNTSKP